MSYKKQNWNKQIWPKGQENFENMLNHMEDGIANAGGGSGDSIWENGSSEGSIQTKGTGCDARGAYSVSEGYGTLAESDLSHAEGWVSRTIIDDTDTETHGHASHAEGSHTIAKGACSHAEGNSTESMGWYSHAEGSGTISGGRSSHAEGDGTITNNVAEHAEGVYNRSHSTKDGDVENTIHSIGIGTSMSARKNAVEVMSNGDQYILGVGGYNGENIEGAKTIQQIINESGTGLSIAVENLNLDNFDDTDKIFYGSAENIYLPEDFFSAPYKYNIIVSIHGTSDDDASVAGYTANHFCYLAGGINMWLCGDKFNFGEGMIDHFTSLGIFENRHLEISYLGLMEPESGSRSEGEPMIKNCYATILIQKLY